MPLTQLPVRLASSHPCLKKLVDIIKRERGRFSFSPSSLSLFLSEHASVALGKDCTCPQGFHGRPTFNTHTHILSSFSAPSLSSLPFPLGFQQSLSQHRVHMQPEQHKGCTCFCEALTMVFESGYFELNPL